MTIQKFMVYLSIICILISGSSLLYANEIAHMENTQLNINI